MKYIFALASFLFALVVLTVAIMGYSPYANTIWVGGLIFVSVLFGIIAPWVLITSGSRR